MKQGIIVSNEKSIDELPHVSPNNLTLRVFGNWEISGKCKNFIDYSQVSSLTTKMINLVKTPEK